MKPIRALVAALSLVILAPLALAQDGPPQRPREEIRPRRAGSRPTSRPAMQGPLQRLQQVIGQLNLSEEQKKQAHEVFEKAQKKMQALRQELRDQAGQRGEGISNWMTKVQALAQETRREVEQFLNDEQKQKLAAAMVPGAPMLERVREALPQLELSAEQKQKVETLVADTQKKLQAITGDDFRAKMEEVRKVMQEMRKGVEEILTPEQREKLRSLLPEPGRERLPGRPAPRPDGDGQGNARPNDGGQQDGPPRQRPRRGRGQD